MLIKYQISNKFQTSTAQTITVSGTTTLNGLSKSLTIPINIDFFPVDYGDDLQDIVVSEREKAINKAFDAETVKYNFNDPYANLNQGLLIKFQFWNTTAQTYDSSYKAVGFTDLEIVKNRNPFRKSFFRLYFYDSNSGDTSSLIFTEDLGVYNTTTPTLPFNRLYWLRSDNFFVKNNTNRTVYMDAKFFNAKTGKINKFVNIPLAPPTIPITLYDYSDPNNRDWRSSAITIINPKLNNGNYNFLPYTPFGANTPTTITLSELIIQ